RAFEMEMEVDRTQLRIEAGRHVIRIVWQLQDEHVVGKITFDIDRQLDRGRIGPGRDPGDVDGRDTLAAGYGEIVGGQAGAEDAEDEMHFQLRRLSGDRLDLEEVDPVQRAARVRHRLAAVFAGANDGGRVHRLLSKLASCAAPVRRMT